MNQVWKRLAEIQVKRLASSAVVNLDFRSVDTMIMEACIQFRDCRLNVEKVGSCTYLGGGSSSLRHVGTIGRFCSIAGNVISGAVEHPTSFITQSSMFHQNWGKFWSVAQDFYEENPQETKLARAATGGALENRRGKIQIGNDVWIGAHAYIRRGVRIGDGAVIGGHAVVTKDVPPYAVVVGNPGRVVKYRFDEDTIDRLCRLRWWDFGPQALTHVDITSVDAGISRIEDNVSRLQPWTPSRAILKNDNGAISAVIAEADPS